MLNTSLFWRQFSVLFWKNWIVLAKHPFVRPGFVFQLDCSQIHIGHSS